MTPKHLRLIARIIAENIFRDRASCNAIAQELEQHASELEALGWTVAEPKEIRLREPLPNPMQREEFFPDAQRGRR